MNYNIDFGMPTLIELDSLDKNVSLCNELELKFIELNMNLPEYQTDKFDTDKINYYRVKYGIYFTIHLDENFNAWDFNNYISDAYLKTLTDTIEIAKKIKAPVINMHMSGGVYFTLPSQRVYLFEKYQDEYMKKTYSLIELCNKCIGESSIKISIENTSGYMDFQIMAIDKLLKNNYFSLTYDVGHSYCNNDVDLPFIIDRKAHLKHIHLHDAIIKSMRKDHLPLGEGEVDIKSKLNLANECGCRIVIETKTVESLKKSMEIVKKY